MAFLPILLIFIFSNIKNYYLREKLLQEIGKMTGKEKGLCSSSKSKIIVSTLQLIKDFLLLAWNALFFSLQAPILLAPRTGTKHRNHLMTRVFSARGNDRDQSLSNYRNHENTNQPIRKYPHTCVHVE